jgi:hypothetical protein
VALARVVTFEGVGQERIDGLKKQIEEGERPEDLLASEMIVLHDADGGKAIAIMFFDSEDDYNRGDATLNAMPSGDTPGQRTSVSKYEVAIRASG